MRRIGVLGVTVTAFLLTGCSSMSSPSAVKTSSPNTYKTAEAPAAPAAMAAPADGDRAASSSAVGFVGPSDASTLTTTEVSLDQASKSQSSAEAIGRKIIRNAELTLEVEDTAGTQQKVAAVAERLGGFVVTSEIAAAGAASPTVTISMRVPAERFGDALAALHDAGTKVIREKTTGQDVTEEYIDLEARLKAKQALEAQFLEIMKRANTVSDALQVQSQIGQVRSEIEQLEGRRRFLENQSSLSTITVTLQSPVPIVEATTEGFGYHVRHAFGDMADTASSIVIFVIRFLGVATPVFVMIVLPGLLVLRWLWRRFQRSGAEPPPSVV